MTLTFDLSQNGDIEILISPEKDCSEFPREAYFSFEPCLCFEEPHLTDV
jgi:hypothetical protein